LGLTGTFVLLSLDEVASFHEMLSVPLRDAWHTTGFLYFAWVIPGASSVLVFLLVFLRFLARIPAETRRGFLWAGFVFCSGCLGMEMIDGRHLTLHGEDLNYLWMSVLEESLEMAGEILFLRSLLAYFAGHVGSLTVRARGADSQLKRIFPLAPSDLSASKCLMWWELGNPSAAVRLTTSYFAGKETWSASRMLRWCSSGFGRRVTVVFSSTL
jgi:hypothetical protein